MKLGIKLLSFLLLVSAISLNGIPANSESLWENSKAAGVNPDVKVGDLVTIQVSESAEGQTNSDREREKEVETGGDANVGGDGTTIFNEIASWIPIFGATITGGSSYESEREAGANNSLNTTMTVRIAEVRSDGMVSLRGQRKVKIDDEVQNLTFEGKARAEDIQGDNTIDSTRVANAKIFYEGRLGLVDGEARGLLDSGYLYIKNAIFW